MYYIVKGSIHDPAEPLARHLFSELVDAKDEAHAVDKALILAACNAEIDADKARWVTAPEVSDAPADAINRMVGAARFPGW